MICQSRDPSAVIQYYDRQSGKPVDRRETRRQRGKSRLGMILSDDINRIVMLQNNEEGKLAKKIKNFIYHPGDVIGSGFSSQVFKGINELEADPALKNIAIKVIELSKIQNEVEKYLLNNQVNALKVLKHPSILRTVDILMTKNNVYIVTEFCEGGDLLHYIKDRGTFSETQALELTSQILMGYSAIEDKKIVHRDLKTSNIFMTRGHAKIADFGFCEFVGEKKPQVAYNVGSPAYMSPESYRENQYSSKSDIWAIGIILYEMLVGETPYRNLTYTEMVNNLTSGRIEGLHNEEIRLMLVDCFKKNAGERTDVKKFLERVLQELQMLRQPGQRKSRVNSNQNNQIYSSVGPHQQSAYQPPIRALSPAKFHKNSHSGFNRVSQVSQSEENSRKSLSSIPSKYSIKAHTQTLLFLYRLLKFVVDIKWERISSILSVLFRHRGMVEALVEKLGISPQEQPYKEFMYLKSRFDEVYLEHVRDHSSNKMYKEKLDHFANHPFTDYEPLLLYRTILREACVESELLLESSQPSINYNQMGIILDYLLIEYEILGLHLEALSFNDVAATANMEKIVKEQPKKLTPAHLELLKLKSKTVFNSPPSFTRHSALN